MQAILSGASAIEPLFSTSQLAFLPPIVPGAGLTLTSLRDRKADEAYPEWLRQLRDKTYVELRLDERG